LSRKPTFRPCRCDDLEARLERVEELARSNRRELDIQFRRIAELQAALDSPMENTRRKVAGKRADDEGYSRPHP
jgi:hypothetical protein